MSTSPWDWVKSITTTKDNLLESEDIKSYEPFIVNKALTYNLDCVLYANEMNMNFFMDKDMQYSFYLNSIRKMKRKFQPWIKKESIKDLMYVKSYYGYNNEKALQVLNILSKDQIDYIKERLDTIGFEAND